MYVYVCFLILGGVVKVRVTSVVFLVRFLVFAWFVNGIDYYGGVLLSRGIFCFLEIGDY